HVKEYPIKQVNTSTLNTNLYSKTSPTNKLANKLDFSTINSFDSFQEGQNVHIIMEKLDFKSLNITDDLSYLIASFNIKQHNIDGIKAFINDDLFNLIKTKTYYKEYAFSYIQDHKLTKGIIDLLVESDDYLYIIDYKSDQISVDELVLRYQDQLESYYNIMKLNHNKPVQALIYSFYNKCFINVK
ncbi:MAG: PD-(D/E)XK nuclease family protein, partial [Bacilli bacterium]